MYDRYQELLAAYASTPHQVLPEVAHEVKRRLIDSLGVMLAALHADAPRAARAYAAQFPLVDGSTLFGTGRRTTPEMAAFANGVLVRYLDFNDTYLSLEPLHPSDVIPALLALAEWRDASPATLIEAIAVAYEVGMDLCDAASLRAHGWDHVNYIAIATACGAARLLGLSHQQAANALSISIVPHAAMRQTRVGELSMWKGAAAANAARNGLFAALLVEQGFSGPFEPFVGEMGLFNQLLAGRAFDDAALARLGRQEPPSRILDSYIKAYPVEYHAQSAVDCTNRLHRQIGDPNRIERIEIDTFKASYEIIASHPEKWQPTTRETADHSLPYIVAVGLLDGRVTMASFAPDRLQAPRVRNLLARTTLREDEGFSALYPQSIPNRITVVTVDGKNFSEESRYPRGHAGNPMADEEVEVKFLANAEAGNLDKKTAQRLLDGGWRLDELSSVRELTALRWQFASNQGKML